jgi:hypothetical protein
MGFQVRKVQEKEEQKVKGKLSAHPAASEMIDNDCLSVG